jgi:hypothetical protein
MPKSSILKIRTAGFNFFLDNDSQTGVYCKTTTQEYRYCTYKNRYSSAAPRREASTPLPGGCGNRVCARSG